MSADKRTFVDFATAFPGSIDTDRNMYVFPTLYKTANTGKVREWTIYIRLIKKDSVNKTETKKQNWELMHEIEVPIKSLYLEETLKAPHGIIAEMWTESGISSMKISRSAATYIESKNVGKKNERNALQQALVTARGKYLKKIDEGSTLNLDTVTDVAVSNPTSRFYPMLAQKYEKLYAKIDFKDLFIQVKLDGNRCVAFLDNIKSPTYKNVILYSRQLKDWPHSPPNDLVRKSLLQMLIDAYDNERMESIYLDGELYRHDLPLQEINSIVRGKGDAGENIEYHVYDHFYPHYEKEGFAERNRTLKTLFDSFTKEQYIKLVKTTEIHSEKECDEIYKDALAKKYEGIMIRTANGPYEKSMVKKSEQLRSKHLIKRKETYDEEFEVVGYTEGKSGKEKGMIVWRCKAKNKNGDTFNVVPNLSHKERYEIFKECEKKFAEKYEGRLLKVEFRGLSNKNIPLQAKAIEFRDYK
jgi:ATP-dependent DNA ligase